MLAKYPNQRWLTVRNDNNLTAADYEALAKLNKNARRLYEAICYKSYTYDTMRFAFSSSAMYYETGIDESDVCKAWKELEDAGIIVKYEGSSNEYYIKANAGSKTSENKCDKNPQSNNIKSESSSASAGEDELDKNSDNSNSDKKRRKKIMAIKSHNKHICIMASMTKTAQLLATELMKGDLDYNAELLSAKFDCDKKSVERAFNELKAANYIIEVDNELHFCSIPYFDCGLKDDKAAHCEFCDTPAAAPVLPEANVLKTRLGRKIAAALK